MFELWVEKARILHNMDMAECIAAFLHLVFCFNLKYPKVSSFKLIEAVAIFQFIERKLKLCATSFRESLLITGLMKVNLNLKALYKAIYM